MSKQKRRGKKEKGLAILTLITAILVLIEKVLDIIERLVK